MGWSTGYAIAHPAYPVGPPLITTDFIFLVAIENFFLIVKFVL
jgi:hypothetical protein